MRNRLVVVTATALAVVLAANLALAARQYSASVRPTWDEDRVLTILVLGSDMGLPRRGDPRRGRSDALHIVAVDTRRLKATIVDIPRDSLVGGRKVNDYMVIGGPERVKKVLSAYTGIDLDYYAMTNFRGLSLMADAMGGIETTLDRAIKDPAAKANLRAGKQRLRGGEALAFVRARKTLPGGDFTRTKHQGQLLRAAHRQLVTRQSDLATITRLIGAFSRNTTTDIPAPQLFRFAALAVTLKPKRVKQVSLRGPFGFAGAASVVHLRAGSAFSDIKKGRIGP